ncbi:hypothetical protein [Erythrobacter sp. CCH5-A1]|uniref:hypothetical protein n=1 Tax=Erythrobacter sp. CCH5-A1 TaxID=1768792 RepID=UPI00082C9C1C|nr:hypothetical protein [Erythrobacter sp. CCH5-A1]
MLAALALWPVASASHACITYREYDETAFLEADLIFVGKLTDYEIVTAQDRYVDEELAVLTYRVDDVLKGEAGKTIRLWWPNSTFELPDRMSRYDATLVAVVRSKAPEGDWSGWLRYPSRNALTALPVVHQQGCSNASIMPVGPHDLVTIERWITAGSADGTPLTYDGVRIGDELPARRTNQIDFLPAIGGMLGGGALVLVIRRWRRRSARSQS